MFIRVSLFQALRRTDISSRAVPLVPAVPRGGRQGRCQRRAGPPAGHVPCRAQRLPRPAMVPGQTAARLARPPGLPGRPACPAARLARPPAAGPAAGRAPWIAR